MLLYQPERQSGLDPQQGYKTVLWIAGLDDSDYSRNDEQEIQDLERQAAFDTILFDGAIMDGLSSIAGYDVMNNLTAVTAKDGVVFTHGRAEKVAGSSGLVYTGLITDATPKVFLRWSLDQVDNTIDPTIVNPNTAEPIANRMRVQTALVATSPDAFDEEFDTFVYAIGGKPAYRDGTAGIVPFNTPSGLPWAVVSGAAPNVVGIGAPKFGRASLKVNHQQNLAGGAPDTLIQLPNAGMPSGGALRTYYVYVWLRTVYGQQDLSGTPGIYVSCGRFGSATFATSGGAVLLGDFVRHEFTFTSDGSSSPFTLQIGIPAIAPSTQVLVDGFLVTSSQLEANPNDVILDRHHIPIMQGAADGQMHPIVVPRSKLLLTDLNGDIPASRVSYIPVTNSDLAATNVQTLLDEVDTKFTSVAAETGGSVANAYIIAPALPVPALRDGLRAFWRVTHTNTAASTLQVSATAAKAILRADGSNIVPGDLVAGQLVLVTFDVARNGWIVPIMPAPATLAGARNLVGNSAVTTFSISADNVVTRNPLTGGGIFLNAFNATVNISILGPALNARDQAGAFTINTFVHLYAIAGLAVTAGLIASATKPSGGGPALPSGYAFWAYLGTVLLDGSGNIVGSRLRGDKISFDQRQAVFTTSVDYNLTTEQAQSVAAFVPDLALSFVLHTTLHTSSGGGAADITVALRYISTVDYYVHCQRLQAALQEFSSNWIEFPNVNRNVFWQLNSHTGVTLWNVYCLGFTVPNGS